MQEMARRIGALATSDGFLPSALPDVRLMRSGRHLSRRPMIYAPSVVIIAQGRKLARFADRTFTYDPGHCLTLNVPLPFESETFGTPSEPVLGMVVRITPALVTELLLQLDAPPPESALHAMQACPMDDALADAALRLLACMRRSEEARILGPTLIRELTYRLLDSAHGSNLRALGHTGSRFGQIAKILNRLHADYAQDHDIERMARDAGMSLSSFHAHFKHVTASSPLQYLKTIRLHRARMFMVNERMNASQAAARVGYESVSQFGREFKRLFGDTPGNITAQLRAILSERGIAQLHGTPEFFD